MSQEMAREVISVSPVGDGNPATALALVRQAEHQDLSVEPIVLSATAHAARLFHQRMTRDPERAHLYVDQSETDRTSMLSRGYGFGSSLEFASRVGWRSPDVPINWTVVQEHPLLGTSVCMAQRLGIVSVRLVTPDVYPKESGLAAVDKHSSNATVFVWNREAGQRLSDKGVKVEITRPYFIDGFHPDVKRFRETGLPIVAKTSGSGIPKPWQHQLRQALEATDLDWAFHTPANRFASDGNTDEPPSSDDRIASFYGDIGGKTRVIIGYPSELVGLVCDMNERGSSTWLLAFPPRGAHEKTNLEFAMRQGIALGELAMDGAHGATFDGLRQIPVAELPKIINNLDQPQWQPAVVGTEAFWDVAK